MARGFLAGAIWGLVVSGAGLAAISVVMGPPANLATAPAVAQAEDPAVAGSETVESEAAPEEGLPETTETSGASGTAAAPVSEPTPESAVQSGPEDMAEPMPEASAEPSAETAPEPEAEPDAEERAQSTPPAVPAARRPSAERGVEATAAGPSLAAPGLAEGAAPDTQPAQRPAPIPAPVAPDAPGTSDAARLDIGSDMPVQPGLPALPPQVPLAEEQPALSTDPAQPPAPVADSGLAAAPEAEAEPARTQGGAAEPEIGEAGGSEPATPAPRVSVLTPEREPAAEPQPGDARPSIGTPADSLLDRDGAVPQRRLPVVAGTEDAPEAAQPAPQDSPLYRYAAAVDLAAADPALSIVLIDDGSGPLGPDTVEAFPFPVSFAISAEHPNAAEAAAAYRSRGFEVLALAELPQQATPADAEVALEGALGAVPEAIGVLEGPDLGLHQSREVGTQAAQFLRDSGHGLVLMANGLNTAEAMAQREGVPALTVFRDFDGKGQDPRVMRRFLDQAAFKARQDGGVVMLGRLRADTVSALLLWGLQDRANSVALVPVSALLQRQTGGE